MTNYDGKDITYDSAGNTLTYNGWTFTWSNGELATAANSDNSVSYQYNASGIRTNKTVNGTTTAYTLDGSTITGETNGTDTLTYTYDSSGSPVSVNYDGARYYYEKNLQGDIIGLVDSSNNEVVTYSYDTWGKLLNIGGSLASSLGKANHLRYRGYYYDTGTGLYYLQSRYYNPEWGRFISKDDQSYHNGESGVKANLYAYGNNNPTINVDFDGHVALALVAGVYFIPGVGEIAITASAIVLTIAAICILLNVSSAAIAEAKVISKADTKIKNTVRRNSKCRYWSATLHADYVDIGRPLSYNQALSMVRQGKDVFTVTAAEALALTTVAGNGHVPVGPEINRNMHNVVGFYWHYHVYREGGHVFYLFG